MSRLDEEEVRRIADLARLELDEEEVRRLAGELGGLLEKLERLRELTAGSGGEEAEGPALRLRPDTPPPEPLARGPEAFAPDWRDGFFVLPRLAAMESGEEDGSDGRAP